jgi:hypothetical protein
VTAPGGSVVASFPRWNWVKGPVRKLRYEVINNCPIFDYTRPQLEALFNQAGYPDVRIHQPGRGGYLVRAVRAPA